MAKSLRDVDLCELVKACSEAGVSRFKHGTLEINFGRVWPEWQENAGPVAISDEMDENEVGIGDEAELRERQSAELLLEDPLAYEKLQLGEEI